TLAGAVVTFVDALQRRHDVAEEAPVTVAELEEELARVRGVRLVAQILDRIVFLILPVQCGLTHLVSELTLLFQQLLLEVGEPILSHRDLLLPVARRGRLARHAQRGNEISPRSVSTARHPTTVRARNTHACLRGTRGPARRRSRGAPNRS